MEQEKAINQEYEELPHILVIDDDDRIRSLVSRYLNEHGFFALSAQNAIQAEKIMKKAEFDALVVDIMMPQKTGLEFLQELRSYSDLPVILLTALGETDDRLTGFHSGADDYLAKPFDPRELVVRLQSLLKRRSTKIVPDGDVKIGTWVFEINQNQLSSEETNVRLTDVEATLLKALVKRAGEVLTRESLAKLCGFDASERSIDVQVTRLRKKLGEDSKAPRYLQTVRGKGYVLRLENEE